MSSQLDHETSLSPTDVRVLGGRKEDGYEKQMLVFQTPFGYRRMAELFQPEGEGPHPLILFLHWYEPEARDSNRSQFVDEAVELARAGAICLTVETLWSDPDFFYKRTQLDDLNNSMEEVVNLRRFIFYLTLQPDADLSRFALVGHDFGGMYGILAGSLDKRPSHYVIMAATPRFPDWYLYLPKLEGEAREAFLREMSPIDPISHVPNLAPAPILFQFGDDDPHVSLERADEFFAAANEPKEKKVYSSGHGLNHEAAQDRRAWLKEKLNLKQGT